MPSQSERNKAIEAKQKEELAAAKAAAPTEAEAAEMLRASPPLERDEAHSFVEAEKSELDPEIAQPNLTNTSMAELEAAYQNDAKIDLVGPAGKNGKGEPYQISGTVEEIERMTDEQIKDAKLLTGETQIIHPARLNPSSERPRTPLQRSPAAGAGTWPVPEDQLPAVMPSDPPVEDRDAAWSGDKTFTGVTGFKSTTSGLTYAKAGTTLQIGKKEVPEAAALYMRLRSQYPHFTTEQLNDEFALLWEGGVGRSQSHRPGTEVSQHGQTAVGDDRVVTVLTGKERLDATEAQPAMSTPAPGVVPATGLPSTNEPASTAPDQAKPQGGTDVSKADAEAIKGAAKFDHDGDGKVGGSKPKTK